MESTLKIVFMILPAALSYTTFSRCPGQPSVASLDLKGCTEPPCKFVRGTNCEFIIEVVTSEYTETLHADVKAFALGTETDYPLPSEAANVCNNLVDAECPLEKGEDVKYHLVFPVSESYPEISLIIQFSILSANGTIGCLRLPAVVVSQ